MGIKQHPFALLCPSKPLKPLTKVLTTDKNALTAYLTKWKTMAIGATDLYGAIENTSSTLAKIHNYLPDFIVITTNGNHWIVETNGLEDINVKQEDNADIN